MKERHDCLLLIVRSLSCLSSRKNIQKITVPVWQFRRREISPTEKLGTHGTPHGTLRQQHGQQRQYGQQRQHGQQRQQGQQQGQQGQQQGQQRQQGQQQ